MTDTLNKDPRIIPLVRSLKDQPMRSNKLLNKIAEDLSSEKTLENSPKLDNDNKNEDNKNNELNKNKNPPKKMKSLNKLRSSNSNTKHNTTIKKSTKISIDAEADKVKSGTSEKKHKTINQGNKIKIVSKNKEQPNNTPNIYHLNSGQYGQKKLNNIKTRSKYVQNLLNDMSIKKYKQSCIDILKNDNLIKKLYEDCGFEKTNYNYENFIQNNFFNKALFMYKLEM